MSVPEFKRMDTAKPSVVGLFHIGVKAPLCQRFLPIFRISQITWHELWRPISKARFSSFLAQHRLPQRPTCMTILTVQAPPCQRVTMSRTAYSCGREIPISNFGLAKVSRKLHCGISLVSTHISLDTTSC